MDVLSRTKIRRSKSLNYVSVFCDLNLRFFRTTYVKMYLHALVTEQRRRKKLEILVEAKNLYFAHKRTCVRRDSLPESQCDLLQIFQLFWMTFALIGRTILRRLKKLNSFLADCVTKIRTLWELIRSPIKFIVVKVNN